MKLSKFNELKDKLETFAFESNFKLLDVILYYFSFLGNIFSIIFSYFFIQSATFAIPIFFPGQEILVSIFVVTFMAGYELLKRFSFKQLVIQMIKVKKATVSLIIGAVFVISLITGSFYLSVNGAHRLIDKSSPQRANRATDRSLEAHRARVRP